MVFAGEEGEGSEGEGQVGAIGNGKGWPDLHDPHPVLVFGDDG